MKKDEEDRQIPHEEYPSTYKIDEIKIKGWEIISSTQNPRKKAFAYIYYIIWADYWRARIFLEKSKCPKSKMRKIMGVDYCSGQLLGIDHYTKNWLHANSNSLPEDVLEIITTGYFYIAEPNEYLPEGMTLYRV